LPPREEKTKPERPLQKTKPKLISSTQGLRKTRIMIEGYVQETTGKLFVEIGQMPAALVAL
jgi:hypothetical protein